MVVWSLGEEIVLELKRLFLLNDVNRVRWKLKWFWMMI